MADMFWNIRDQELVEQSGLTSSLMQAIWTGKQLIEAQTGVTQRIKLHTLELLTGRNSRYGIRLTKDSLKLHGSSRKGSTSIPPKGIMELKRKVKAGFVFTPLQGKAEWAQQRMKRKAQIQEPLSLMIW